MIKRRSTKNAIKEYQDRFLRLLGKNLCLVIRECAMKEIVYHYKQQGKGNCGNFYVYSTCLLIIRL